MPRPRLPVRAAASPAAPCLPALTQAPKARTLIQVQRGHPDQPPSGQDQRGERPQRRRLMAGEGPAPVFQDERKG
jgi:hypothetical protein